MKAPWGRALVALTFVLASCGPKTVELPAPTTTPRYPDFIFPAAPDGLGNAASQERHKAGWLWLQTGDLRAAQRNFEAAIKLDRQFYPAEAGLGFVRLAKNDHSEAVDHFDRAVVANPRYVPALVGRGEALLALGEREMALKSFEAAVVADASQSALRSRIEVLRARALQDDVAAARKAAELGRLDDARRAYEQSIAASPDSPFLYRELAAVAFRQHDLSTALTQARKAEEMEPGDVRTRVLIAEVLEAQGDLASAVEAYDAALALEPNDALERKIEDLRKQLTLQAMPPEFHTIDSSPTLSRAQLAALVGVRLDDLLQRAPRRSAVVITDTRGNWAGPWILSVTRAGVMEVYPNHTFQPAAAVSRGDLAQTASRVLTLIAAEKPQRAAAWRNARHRFPDVSPAHLSYSAASVTVEAGIMGTLEDGSFQLGGLVTGADAVDAIKKLEALAQTGPERQRDK
jgi:tetratricopeptide (TPR) repeat protein